jgi:hypothetical protein
MSATELKLCRDCKYSNTEIVGSWEIECLHPKVNATNPWVLGTAKNQGKTALDERRHNWTLGGRTPCGNRGALFEPKKEK